MAVSCTGSGGDSSEPPRIDGTRCGRARAAAAAGQRRSTAPREVEDAQVDAADLVHIEATANSRAAWHGPRAIGAAASYKLATRVPECTATMFWCCGMNRFYGMLSPVLYSDTCSAYTQTSVETSSHANFRKKGTSGWICVQYVRMTYVHL